jgi:hypothetical protein
MKLMALTVLMSLALLGCAYGGVAPINKGKDVIITRNDHCLFGTLRKVYTCSVSKSGGLAGCKETTAP